MFRNTRTKSKEVKLSIDTPLTNNSTPVRRSFSNTNSPQSFLTPLVTPSSRTSFLTPANKKFVVQGEKRYVTPGQKKFVTPQSQSNTPQNTLSNASPTEKTLADVTPPPRLFVLYPPKANTTSDKRRKYTADVSSEFLSCFERSARECWDGFVNIRSTKFVVYHELTSIMEGSFMDLFRSSESARLADFLGVPTKTVCIKVFRQTHLLKKRRVLAEYFNNGLEQYKCLNSRPTPVRTAQIYNIETALSDGFILAEYLVDDFLSVEKEWSTCKNIDDLSKIAGDALRDTRDWFEFSIQRTIYDKNDVLVLDLKPANFRLTPAGKVVLIDFLELKLEFDEMLAHFRQCLRLLCLSNPVIDRYFREVPHIRSLSQTTSCPIIEMTTVDTTASETTASETTASDTACEFLQLTPVPERPQTEETEDAEESPTDSLLENMYLDDSQISLNQNCRIPDFESNEFASASLLFDREEEKNDPEIASGLNSYRISVSFSLDGYSR